MEPCRFHPALQESIETLVGKAAAQEAYSKTQKDQIGTIFIKLDAIKSVVDKNEVSALNRDSHLDEIKKISHASLAKWTDIKEDVCKLQSTVENGINARVDALAKTVGTLCEFLDRRKAEQLEDEEEFGMWRKFARSLCRGINSLWEKNGVVIVFFALWLMFGGDGHVMHDIIKFFTGIG